jgi:hypothetical protein
MAIETAAKDKAMNALDGPPRAGRPCIAEFQQPPIRADMNALSSALCGSVSTSMDANRAGRGSKGKAEAEVVALFPNNNARRPFALFPCCLGPPGSSLPMLRPKTQRSEYMEQNYLATLFEQVLDAYDATGFVPDELISEAQHSIMMARAPV